MTRRQGWLLILVLAGILLVLAWPGLADTVNRYSPVHRSCVVVDTPNSQLRCDWHWGN